MAEDGAGWLAFLRALRARGLKGVKLLVLRYMTINARAPILAQTLTLRGHTCEAASTWKGRSAAQMELPSAFAPPMPALSEDREVVGLRAGDERAFLALVNRHHRGMRSSGLVASGGQPKQSPQ